MAQNSSQVRLSMHGEPRRRLLATVAVLALSNALASGAWAQTTPAADQNDQLRPRSSTPSQPPAAASDAPAPQQSTLPAPIEAQDDPFVEQDSADIVVTAQRRAERLQDVPIAVNVVDSTQIGNAGIREITELSAIIPGLNIAYTTGAFQPSVRGISTSSNVVENPTALFVDGVYLPNQREGLRDLADIEQIAVLKGPQGTLFGRNATAGVIQITTRRPSFDRQAAFTLGFDDYETIRTSGYITGGVTDDIAASLSVSYSTQGQGYGKSLTAGWDTYRLEHSLSARGKILFTPGDNTEITFIADYLDRRDSGSNYQPYPGTTFSYPGFGPVTSRYDTYASVKGFNKYQGGGLSLTIDQDLDFAKLVSISSYREGEAGFLFDFTNVATPLIIGGPSQIPYESFTQELQLVSPSDDAFRYVVGAFYIHNRLGYDPFPRTFTGAFSPLPTSNRTLTTNAYETTESIAPFAQIDWEFLPDTTLTLGGRFTFEERSISGRDTIVRNNGTTTVLETSLPAEKVEEPTWRIALNHKFTPDILGYVSWNRGFKSGGFNFGSPNAPAYDPETLDAYEVGLKTQLFDRRLTFNIGAFFYKYTNLQVSAFIGGQQVPTVTNGAESELYGVDVDFRAQVTDELSLSGGFEVLNATFTDYQNAVISMPRPTGGAIIGRGDATGNRLPLSQEFVGTLAFDYAKDLGPAKINFNVTGTYNGDYFLESDNFLRQDDYVMLNSSFKIAEPDDRLSLTFAVSNILNEAIIARNITQTFAYLINYAYAPRVYSVTAGFKF